MAKTLVSDIPEPLEIPFIPESVDIVESSTTYKQQRSLLASIERKSDNTVLSSTTLIENLAHPLSEQTTAKSLLDKDIQEKLVNADKINSDANKISIQVEEPVEIRENFKLAPFLIPHATNFTDKIEAAHSSEMPKKSNKAKELLDASVDLKQQELEPLLLAVDSANSTKFLENDIKSTFIKKTELNRFDIPKPANGNYEPLPSHTTTTTTPTPNHDVAVEPTKSTCAIIYLMIRSESLNITLGSDEICHNFNITYNIPLSKYMKENRFDLVFM